METNRLENISSCVPPAERQHRFGGLMSPRSTIESRRSSQQGWHHRTGSPVG